MIELSTTCSLMPRDYTVVMAAKSRPDFWYCYILIDLMKS